MFIPWFLCLVKHPVKRSGCYAFFIDRSAKKLSVRITAACRAVKACLQVLEAICGRAASGCSLEKRNGCYAFFYLSSYSNLIGFPLMPSIARGRGGGCYLLPRSPCASPSPPLPVRRGGLYRRPPRRCAHGERVLSATPIALHSALPLPIARAPPPAVNFLREEKEKN